MKITDKQRKILEDNFNVDNDEDNLMELESWTNGGVDMMIYIDTNNELIEELENYLDNFNVDEEIDLYRQGKDYRDNFTISESLIDFENYIEFVKGVIKQLRESDKTYTNKCGVCPKCEKEDLEYGSIKLEGNMCYFPYKCKNCGLEGEEWYSMEFAGHSIYNKNGDYIEL